MEKKIIFQIPALYRDDFRITGYSFGSGEKSACIVGSLRGNENQQLYICSQLIRRLKQLESEGKLVEGKEILVIPSANAYSMNIKKRFWSIDNTDINRMFPGYNEGETTQRIAGGLFDAINQYTYGMQFASFYMPGNFIPHVRVMKINELPNVELLELAKQFELPYVVSHAPRPYDTATLNYNWQIWGTKAFSIYTTTTDEIDHKSAKQAITGILHFLTKQGVIQDTVNTTTTSAIVATKQIVNVRTKKSGFLDPFVKAGDQVEKGQLLAEIVHTYEGEVLSQITAPIRGTILFARNEYKTYENTAVFKIVPLGE